MDALYEAAFNRTHRILWYRLTPYSADHLFALGAIDSPFSRDTGYAEASDLVHALKVCSRTKLHEVIQLGLLDRLAVWILGNPFLLRRALAQFSVYLVDYSAFPEFWEDMDIGEGKAGKLSGNPILARVISVLKKCPSVTESRAWQMPIGLLVWYDEQAGELEGNGKRFWHDGEESEIEEALRKAEEEARIIQEANHV